MIFNHERSTSIKLVSLIVVEHQRVCPRILGVPGQLCFLSMERALNSAHTTTELAPVDGRRGARCGKRKATKVPKGDSVYQSGKLGCYLLLGGPQGITGMRSSRVLRSPGTAARQVGRLLNLCGLISVSTHYGRSCPHSFPRID